MPSPSSGPRHKRPEHPLVAVLRAVQAPSPTHKQPGTPGVVTAAGTPEHWLNLVVAVGALREVGCTLPVDVFHLAHERPPSALPLPAGVTVRPLAVDGLRTWAVKPWSLWATAFDRCLWLDVDDAPLLDPTPFIVDADLPLLWPDAWRSADRDFLTSFGVAAEEPETESGQLVWPTCAFSRALWLACLLNREHRELLWAHTLGDKDSYRLALAVTGEPFQRIAAAAHPLGDHALFKPIPGTDQILQVRGRRGGPRETGLLQHSPDGAPAFVHRTVQPWRFYERGSPFLWVQALDAPHDAPPLSIPPAPTGPPPSSVADFGTRWSQALADSGWHADALLDPAERLKARSRVWAEVAASVPLGGVPR